MSYTAIVLDRDSVVKAYGEAIRLGIVPGDWTQKLHHCTLRMGVTTDVPEQSKLGTNRRLVVTHYGVFTGHVTAFKIAGAEDSTNPQPHITIAVAPGCKPVESNQIVCWTAIDNFDLFGRVEICH